MQESVTSVNRAKDAAGSFELLIPTYMASHPILILTALQTLEVIIIIIGTL